MQSTNIRQIKAALWEQAFLGSTRVSCPMGSVVAIRRRKGQLLAMIRGWGRWYPVESVRIEGTGPQLLQEGPIPHPPGTVLAWSPWADQEASLPCPPSEAGGKYPTK